MEKEIGQNASDMQPVRIRGVIEHPDCAVLQEKTISFTGGGGANKRCGISY